MICWSTYSIFSEHDKNECHHNALSKIDDTTERSSENIVDHAKIWQVVIKIYFRADADLKLATKFASGKNATFSTRRFNNLKRHYGMAITIYEIRDYMKLQNFP